jgi:hypothetical protein
MHADAFGTDTIADITMLCTYVERRNVKNGISTLSCTMRQKIVQGPEATELVESCQRNCLLALSLVYVPMPGMPRSSRGVNCSCCCLLQSSGFAGHAKDLISGESAMATRSLVISASDPSATPPVFALTSVLRGEAVHAVFSHVHTPDETRLALNTIELLVCVSSYDEPQDMDMVWFLLVLNCSI